MLVDGIRKTWHYIECHEKEVPWPEVVEAILATKSRRKSGDKIQIETPGLYLLCRLEGTTLWVINAKRK